MYWCINSSEPCVHINAALLLLTVLFRAVHMACTHSRLSFATHIACTLLFLAVDNVGTEYYMGPVHLMVPFGFRQSLIVHVKNVVMLHPKCGCVDDNID